MKVLGGLGNIARNCTFLSLSVSSKFIRGVIAFEVLVERC